MKIKATIEKKKIKNEKLLKEKNQEASQKSSAKEILLYQGIKLMSFT